MHNRSTTEPSQEIMVLRNTTCLLALLTLFSRVSAECPSSCSRLSGAFKCCIFDKTICCKGTQKMDDCFIDKPIGLVETVYVRGCRMEELSQKLLRNISQHPVKHVQFTDVTIGTIDKEPFKNLPNLSSLVLANTNDVNIPALSGALESIQGADNVSVTLRNIGIRDEQLERLFDKSFTSRVVALSLEGNELEVLPLQLLETWPVLRSVNVKANKISRISAGKLKYLQILMLNGNRMAECDTWQNLNGSLPGLTSLNMANNAITSLNVIDWGYFPSLRSLVLSQNQIKFLNYTSLQPLKQLEILDLSKNWLSNRTYDTPVPSLKRINLAHNQFSQFAPWFCSKNGTAISKYLEYLDLSFNLIRLLPLEALSCLYKLKVLNLEANPLIHLKNNTFATLTSLEELNLNDNRNGGLEYVEQAAFNNTHLSRLILSRNRLVFVERLMMLEIFKYTTNLTLIDLSYNKLSRLNESHLTTLFSPLIKIEKLILKACDLYRLPTGLLEMFKGLATLNLDRNNFETRDLYTSFIGVHNLSNLSLYHNYIRIINEYSLPHALMLNLKHLNLAYNPFDCSCANRWFFDQIMRNKANPNGLHLVYWPNGYKCRTPIEVTGRWLLHFQLNESECEPVNFMIIAYITIACFLLVFSITTGLFYKFRWYITYWRYKMLRRKECTMDKEMQPLLRNNLKYDACSVYCHKDEAMEAFLVNEFSPMIDKLGYKVFIWDRDAGYGATVSEVGDAMYGSNNAIAIITNSFLKDPWCKFQIEVALDREIELQREFLTIIVTEEVDFKLLSKFWCVRFTKTPTMQWCSDKNDIRRKALEAFLKKRLGKPC